MPDFSSVEPIVMVGAVTASVQMVSPSGIAVQASVAVGPAANQLSCAECEAMVSRRAAEAFEAAALQLRRAVAT